MDLWVALIGIRAATPVVWIFGVIFGRFLTNFQNFDISPFLFPFFRFSLFFSSIKTLLVGGSVKIVEQKPNTNRVLREALSGTKTEHLGYDSAFSGVEACDFPFSVAPT